jgi:hypothetical protein
MTWDGDYVAHEYGYSVDDVAWDRPGPEDERRAEDLWGAVNSIPIPRRLYRWLYQCPADRRLARDRGLGWSPVRLARWRRSRRPSHVVTTVLNDARDAVYEAWHPDSAYYAFDGGGFKPFDNVMECVPEFLDDAERAVTSAVEAVRKFVAAYIKPKLRPRS